MKQVVKRNDAGKQAPVDKRVTAVAGDPFRQKLMDEVKRLEKKHPEVRDAIDLPI
ncbi:MAG: hypothetical protein ABIG39_04265 [Candidatus Micrarchaeota archaeon]